MPESVPDALARWLTGEPIACRCGRQHRLEPCRVVVGRGALDALGELVPGPGGPALVISDRNTHDAAGARTARALRGEGWTVREAVFEASPHADEAALASLEERARDGSPPAVVVAVGSGTMNDLGKEIAGRLSVPLVTVATAASMNGYLSPVAALTVRGLKVTSPAPPPVALLVDLDILAAAPKRMTAAGFGDLVSKPVSGADWLLAGWLLGEPVCPTALCVADEAVARTRAVAPAIARGELAALFVLVEGLLLSGISMAIAGASSPASGGEHLVSHYLDMSEAAWERPHFLHGEQVGVASRASLGLYRRIFQERGAVADAIAPVEPPGPAFEALHAHLTPEARAEIRREAAAKRDLAPARQERRALLASGWRELAASLEGQLAGADDLAADLVRAGAPTRFSDIGVSAARAGHLMRAARHLRRRYTVLDLASDLGRLDAWALEIAEDLA